MLYLLWTYYSLKYLTVLLRERCIHVTSYLVLTIWLYLKISQEHSDVYVKWTRIDTFKSLWAYLFSTGIKRNCVINKTFRPDFGNNLYFTRIFFFKTCLLVILLGIGYMDYGYYSLLRFCRFIPMYKLCFFVFPLLQRNDAKVVLTLSST